MTRDVMVNLTQPVRKKKVRVLPTGVEPMTTCLLVQIA